MGCLVLPVCWTPAYQLVPQQRHIKNNACEFLSGMRMGGWGWVYVEGMGLLRLVDRLLQVLGHWSCLKLLALSYEVQLGFPHQIWSGHLEEGNRQPCAMH